MTGPGGGASSQRPPGEQQGRPARSRDGPALGAGATQQRRRGHGGQHPVIARAERPVVVVRPGERVGGGAGVSAAGGQHLDVVIGLDLSRPCDELISYAFEAATACAAGLRVIHGWTAPAVFDHAPAAADPGHRVARGLREASALTDALRPWRGTFPQVEVTERGVVGRAAHHLVDAFADASLVVVGRRIRRAPFVPHVGTVTHAVLHHAAAPVAGVPHL